VSSARSGFTLLELLLVMAILLVVMAIGVPAIDSMMASGNVKAARDMVRARWADMRGRAMKEGRPYVFSVMYNTGKFMIAPEDPNEASDSGDDPSIDYEGELPPNVLFAKADGAASAAPSGGTGYEPLAVYLADGTARDDVQIMFGNGSSQSIGLQIRSLTGQVTMVDPPKGGSQ
jgi:prepilin-type N-terminal cleavage/methylation domain-containing protein